MRRRNRSQGRVHSHSRSLSPSLTHLHTYAGDQINEIVLLLSAVVGVSMPKIHFSLPRWSRGKKNKSHALFQMFICFLLTVTRKEIVVVSLHCFFFVDVTKRDSLFTRFFLLVCDANGVYFIRLFLKCFISHVIQPFSCFCVNCWICCLILFLFIHLSNYQN